MADHSNYRGLEHIGKVIHKERTKEINNKTNGQHDKLKGYGNKDTKSSDKLTTDKLIQREANFMKNLHIDKAYEDLLRMNVITEGKNRNWYFSVLHKLGVTFVMAQADQACKNAKDQDNPAPLFHFLINKAINKANDAYMPRFGR